MNFALIASLIWLFVTPEKQDAGDYPRDKLVNGGVYIIQNEADSSVLSALDPGVPGFRPGYVNTTKWRITLSTTWSIEYFKDNRFFTVHSQNQNNTHNELALVVDPSKDSRRPDTYNRYWNITFGGRSFGFDKWLIIDFAKGNNPNGTGTCLENAKKGNRVKLAECEKENRRQRWRLCLCSLPPLPKGVLERDRIIERI